MTPKKNFFREIPQEILQDKEALYEESLNLKQIIKNLRDENTKLKTKVSKQEKDAVKYEKLLHDVNEERDLPGRYREVRVYITYIECLL